MSDEDDDAPRPAPRGLAVGAWGLGLFAACRLLQIFLDAQATAAAIGQAVLAEWGSSRLGVVWTPLDRTPSAEDGIRRGAMGALIGFGVALVVVALVLASPGARLEGVSGVSLAVVLIGLVTACVHAWRDELLLHGIPLRALGMFDKGDRPARHDLFRVVACGVTSAGAALGRSDPSFKSIAAAFLLGIVLGSLWARDRAAWMPFGAHAALKFALETLAAGGLAHLRPGSAVWGGGDAGIFGGAAAVVALLPLAAAAMFMTMRRFLRGISPESPRVG